MKKAKQTQFIPFVKRTEVQTEKIDNTVYTDPLFNCDRKSLMKDIEIGLPKPEIQFLNGRALKCSNLIENLEEVQIVTDSYLEHDFKKLAAEQAAKHEEAAKAAGGAPKIQKLAAEEAAKHEEAAKAAGGAPKN